MLSAGGLPVGRSTLVAGRSGTGKTIFGLQAAAHMARNGMNTIVVGVEETAEDLLATGDGLGFNLSGLFAEGKVHIAEMMRPLEEPAIISGDDDPFGLVHRIEHLEGKTGAKAIVLDSATALFSPRPPQDGSAHATHPYRLGIGAGGLHIERWSAEGHDVSITAEERWTDARS